MVRISVAVITLTKGTLGGKGFSAYTLREVRTETQDRYLEAGIEAEAMEEFACFTGCSTWVAQPTFLYYPG